MAIYRPPKARWPLATFSAVAGLLCGLLIGLAIGSRDPDPIDSARDIQGALVAAAGSLEVAAIEYEEAVGEGGVERETEYEGSLDAFASSRARYDEVRPALQILVPTAADTLDDLYELCGDLMEDGSDPSEVEECLVELQRGLKGQE